MSLGNTNIHQQGEIPEITKLPNGRIRVVRRFVKFTREDVDNVQLGTLLGNFGDLDTDGEQIQNQGYTNCRLIEVEVERVTKRSAGTDSKDNVLVQTYETLTGSFVETTDPTISVAENGLRQITKVYRAISGTVSSGVVGVTQLASGEFLASSQIEDNTAFAELTEIYLEAGILSETLDSVGSQKAKVIETIGIDPVTPDGYLLANKKESDFEGFQTNQFTFLKPSILSRNIDTRNQGNLKIETVESFNLDPTSTINGVLISEKVSDVEGIPTNQNVYAEGSGEVSRTIETRNNGALTITTVEALGSAGTAIGLEIEATTREEDGYTLFRNTFADGQGEVSRTTEKRNQGKLTVTTIESLGSAGTATGVEIEATTREQDGYTLFRNTFADGNGEVSRTTETRNKGALTITTVEALGAAGSATGLEIEATTREQDGYTLFRNVYADGQGEVSRTTETRNQGKLTVTTVESLGSAGSASGIQIEATTREQDGYTLFRNTFADGQGEVSLSVETRNNGKLTVTTVEALGAAGSATGIEIEATTREQNGYTLFRNVFADGQGEVSRTVETRNQGKLTITTVEALGSAESAGGVEIEATTREQDGYILFRNTFASGQGEVSRAVETKNQGALTITTVEALGSAGSANGVEIEATAREQDGYTLFRNTFASGTGEVSRTVETRNQGNLTVTTVESLGSAGTGTGVEIEATTREQDGYTLFRNTFADGQGEVSRTTETRNKGALTITTVEALGSAGSAAGVEIEATTREQDGYTLFRNTFAEGNGEVSRTVETKNKGKLTITTVEALGAAGTGTGVEIEATTREQDGYTLFRNTFAEGNGEVSRTTETRNQSALTITTVEALGAAGTATGVEIEATTREQDGYTLFRNTFADGQGEVSRTVETRNNSKLTITTVEALGAAGTGTGVEIEATTREQDGYTLFRNVFANGNGEVSRTTESRNQGKLTITTVEALGSAGSAGGVGIEATTREQDGYTLFRNTFAEGNGEVSRTTEKRNQGKLTITTVEALGSAGSATGLQIESTTREQDGYTLFRNVFADGNGEVSRTTETKNQGKLTITTVEALGAAESANGVEIEATRTEQDGYTLFRNVFAEGDGRVSSTVDTRNNGKLTITTVEALGAAESATGVEIEATTREQDGYTLFRNTFADGQGEVSRKIETRSNGALIITTIEALGAAEIAEGVEIEATTEERNGYTLFRNVFANAVNGSAEVRVRTRTGPAAITGSTIKRIVSIGDTAVESNEGELIDSTDEKADGYTIFTREYLVGATEGIKRTYSDSYKVRVPGAIQLQQVAVSIEGVSGYEGAVIDTPPSTQTIPVDVVISIEKEDPPRERPPFDMGKIRCSLSMERIAHSYRGFQSFRTFTPAITDEEGNVTTAASENVEYYPKQTVTSSASGRVYPERFLIGPDSLVTEFRYQSQLNRTEQQGGGVPLANVPLYDTKQCSMRVTGSQGPDGYKLNGTLQTESRPIITLLNGETYYEVVRYKTNGLTSVEYPKAQSGSSGSGSTLGVPTLPDNPPVEEEYSLYSNGSMNITQFTNNTI